MKQNNIKFNFYSKNYVVTGGGKGIGYSTVTKLYDSGANVALMTRSESDIKKIKKKFSGKRIIAFCGDVSKHEDRNEFYKIVKKKMKLIDGLINNAGIRHRKKFELITYTDLDTIYENNLKSVFFFTQKFLKIIKKKYRLYCEYCINCWSNWICRFKWLCIIKKWYNWFNQIFGSRSCQT